MRIKKSVGKLVKRENLTGHLFILPTMIGFLVFIIGPMIAAIVLSFFYWDMFTPPNFIGLDNYKTLFKDPHVFTVFKNTLIFVVGVVMLNVGGGLLIALALNRRIHAIFRYILRTTYFFPMITSVTAIALVWNLLLNTDLGIVNYYLGKIGIPRINWLLSSRQAKVSVILIEVWKNIGFYMIVCLAGLQNIPRQLYEAAEIDGAGGLQRFLYITFPLLTPTIFFLIIIGLINAFQIFDMPFVLTRGGPGDATRTVVMYIYETGFRFFNMGYAATVSLLLFVLIAALTLIQFRVSKGWVFYR